MKKSNFSVLKMIIFLMFFLTVLTLFLNLYIIPAMKKYKTNEAILKNYEKIYKKQKKDVSYLIKKKKLIEKKYQKSIVKYNNPFDENDFIKQISTCIKNTKFEKNKKSNITKYKIKGYVNTLNDFIKLIKRLNVFTNILKINFPIILKKENKSYFIEFYVTIVNKKLKKL